MARRPKSSSDGPGLPSPDAILEFVRGAKGKVGKREIARAFGITGGDKISLKRLLREMEDQGQLAGGRDRLHRPGDLPIVTILQVDRIDENGDPSALPVEWEADWGEAPRIRLAAPNRSRREPAPGLGDRVLARLVPDAENAGFLGKVIKVIERRPKAVLGVYRERDGLGRIVPIDRRGSELVVSAAARGGAVDGELVSAELAPGRRLGLPSARIVERIGDVSSEKAISLIALEEHGIPYRFPPEVLQESEAAEPAGMAHREDWRSVPLVTIDPPDARDHDDAVHAELDPAVEGGFILTVAIADVSWYVREGSAMDREAQRRGNSVYFPGRVVPMLPERISNDLCSLREGEDRPAMAVRMVFDAGGRKTAHRFHRVMMRSAAKLSYEEAQAAIDGTPSDKAGPLLEPVLRPLWDAYRLLAMNRDARQPLGINIPERKVILAEDGSVDRIVVPPRLDAHRLIEEFMIQANVCAAEMLEARKSPVVYRIHDEPGFEKLDALRDFLGSLDMSFPKAGNLRPSHFNTVLDRVVDTPNALLVNEVVLRSQSQAEYAVENIGHFGLNLRRYAHFTSPIRRYADLLVHRSLIAALNLGEGGLRPGTEADLDRIAGEISVAERRAMKAERDTVDRLVAAWLAERVGATFDGHIRGVTRAGLFVEMDETGADGFVPISTIGADFYEYDETQHRLVGRSTGETFRLGDAVEVRLVEALPFAGSLRFELLSAGTPGKPSRNGPRRIRPKVPARGDGAPPRGGPRTSRRTGRRTSLP